MAKKKQNDFQKTKLRVGKTLPKGKNVTDTSFKTRKIATRDQIKSVTGELSLKDILGYLSHNNVSVKKENLAKLTNYIIDNKDSLTLFFPDVLKRVGGMLMESDHNVRMVVIDVLHTALRMLTDGQVGCFFTSLTSYMHCMLTHCDTDVRLDSLQLLDRVLGTHPRVFCQATTVLQGLLNLISSATKKGRKRRLEELISSSVSSQQMRAEVLSHILTFLECLFEKPADREDDDERETYWDAKEPLFLPLYPRGGLTPLEEADAKQDQSASNTQEFKDFVCDLLPLLLDIIKGEIPHKRASREKSLEDKNMSDNLVDSSVVSNLNVAVQVLCCVGEWMLQQTPFDDAKNEEFEDLITTTVCNQLFSYFPYQQLHTSHKQKKSETETKKETTCLSLNLGCSYLYCMFVLESETGSSHARRMLDYLEEVYNVYSGMSEKTLNLIIKINKLLMRSPNVAEVYKNGLLLGLYGVLDTHKLSACVKPLYSFLMDISLEYEFKSLLDIEAMKTWFNIILKEILIMVETNSVNKRFFKYVRQICARKYPYFVDLLNGANPDNFLDLLKYDNEELHLTITQMITCLDQPSGVLDGLIDVICDPCFSLKSAVRIIRLLHARFSGPKVPDHEKLFFVKFLLNLGCDSLSLVDPSSEVIIPDMLKSVMEGCRYTIRPSDKWDRHLKITEVCFECLPCYLQTDFLVLNLLKFLNAVLYQHTLIPIHSTVALLKLRRETFEIKQSEDLMSFYGELLFSSLMYLSVMLTEESKGEAMKPYALNELKNSLGLELEDVDVLIQIIKINIHSFGENEMYHVLRMTQFLIHVNILRFEDRKEYYPILENINSTWHRSNLLHPLWTNICKFFRLL